MKQYPKTYQDLSQIPSKKILSSIGSSLGSIDQLAVGIRSFYRDTHLVIFDIIVKQVWYEQKFLYDGKRRAGRSRNGWAVDFSFSYFMKSIVGISQKPLTTGDAFVSIPTYFKDFFPNFSDHSPFEEPEYFKYPYKHITLDHLMFVYQCDERIEMLEEAEKRSMNIQDFYNWATNYVLCYNDEKGKEIYKISRHSFTPYIRKIK